MDPQETQTSSVIPETNQIQPETIPVQPTPPARKFSPALVLTAVMLLVVVGAGGIWLGKSLNTSQKSARPTVSPLPTQTPIPTSDITTNRKTYINAKLGYSFRYPSDSQKEEVGDLVWIDKQITMTVSQMNPEECRGDCPVIEGRTSLELGGKNFKVFYAYIGSVGGNTPQSVNLYVLPYGSKFFMVNVYELKNDVFITDPNKKPLPIPADITIKAHQILSTLRFD